MWSSRKAGVHFEPNIKKGYLYKGRLPPVHSGQFYLLQGVSSSFISDCTTGFRPTPSFIPSRGALFVARIRTASSISVVHICRLANRWATTPCPRGLVLRWEGLMAVRTKKTTRQWDRKWSYKNFKSSSEFLCHLLLVFGLLLPSDPSVLFDGLLSAWRNSDEIQACWYGRISGR